MWWTPWLWSFRITGPPVWTCTRCVASCPTARARPPSGRRARRAAGPDCVGEARRPASTSRRQLDRDGQRRLLLHAGCARPDEDAPADLRGEPADDLANRRREDVDAADDQHVVGAADAADARRRAPARAGARPDLDVVARAEPQERRGPVAQVREHELAASRRRAARSASPVSGSISSAWTKPRAPRCMPACSSHSPQSDGPMSPIPIASVTRAPQPSSSAARNAGSPPPGSPATRIRRTLESRSSPSSSR